MHYKITYPCMPWELDYALLSFTQFKKSKYYLNGKDTIEINPSLNLSSYLVNWEKSKISKKLLINRFNQYLKLLSDYKVTPIIYEGDEKILPRKEFELLSLLASKPNKVFEREVILDRVWGNEVIVGGRTIDVHIRKLREKIGDRHFKTVKGVGYKYVI